MVSYRHKLRELFTKFRLYKADLSLDANRSIVDSSGKNRMIDTVIPIVGYDMDTGDIVNLTASDTDAYHKSTAGEIVGTTSATPASGDKFLFEDATDSNNKKSCDYSDLGVDVTQDYDWTGDHSHAVTKKISFGDKDSYFTERSDDIIDVYIAGTRRWYWNGSNNIVCERQLRFDGTSCNIYGASSSFFINMNGNQITNCEYLELDEITTPTATGSHGKIYTKNDDKLYFQDGAGTEHEIAFV